MNNLLQNASAEIIKYSDQTNRKPEDQKNDQRAENAKKHEIEKMNCTVLNLIFSSPKNSYEQGGLKALDWC